MSSGSADWLRRALQTSWVVQAAVLMAAFLTIEGVRSYAQAGTFADVGVVTPAIATIAVLLIGRFTVRRSNNAEAD